MKFEKVMLEVGIKDTKKLPKVSNMEIDLFDGKNRKLENFKISDTCKFFQNDTSLEKLKKFLEDLEKSDNKIEYAKITEGSLILYPKGLPKIFMRI